MTIEIARDRMAAMMETVQRARARRDELRAEGGDAAALRAAEAELAIQREALEAARDDLSRLEKRARCEAQERFDAELREMAARVIADVDAVLAGALALRRAIGLARARKLHVPAVYAPLPAPAERALEGWRDRLRRIAGLAADDAA